MSGQALASRTCQVVEPDVRTTWLESSFGRHPLRTLVAMPLSSGSRCAGVLELAFTRELGPGELEALSERGRLLGVLLLETSDQIRIRELLDETRAQSVELRAANEQLAKHAQELETQQHELRAANAELDSRRRSLERSRGELERANADLEQFVHIVSHDLTEPLRSVGSFCELVSTEYETLDDDERIEYLSLAVQGSRRMQALISDLRRFLSVGEGGTATVPVPLAVVIERARDDLAKAISESGARIRVTDELPTVHGDPSLLSLLFQNLLSNAIKYTGDDPPEVDIRCSDEGQMWRISVQDSGIGIDPRYHARVFQIFKRLHSVEERPGTGMGLALCRRITEQLGGRLTLDSTPGDGSTFHVWLPRAGSPAASPG